MLASVLAEKPTWITGPARLRGAVSLVNLRRYRRAPRVLPVSIGLGTLEGAALQAKEPIGSLRRSDAPRYRLLREV